MMKRFLLGAALAAPLACFAAGGPIDGAYQCSVSGETVFVAVVGYPDGRSAFGILAVGDSFNSINGYGMGQVSGPTFSGTTDSGGTFNLAISGTHIAGSIQLEVNGQLVNANASCDKIY